MSFSREVVKNFNDVMRLLPREIEYSRLQLSPEDTEEDKKRHLAQGFMLITFWLNHNIITLYQADQFRKKWQGLSGYKILMEKEGDRWVVRF